LPEALQLPGNGREQGREGLRERGRDGGRERGREREGKKGRREGRKASSIQRHSPESLLVILGSL